MEEIQTASERTLAACNLNRDFNQLRNARAALLRIEEGSFGTCQQCDDDIHLRRLAAVPWAAFLHTTFSVALPEAAEGRESPAACEWGIPAGLLEVYCSVTSVALLSAALEAAAED